VTGVQTCALPISADSWRPAGGAADAALPLAAADNSSYSCAVTYSGYKRPPALFHVQCIEDCEERFSEQQIEELLALVDSHLGAAA